MVTSSSGTGERGLPREILPGLGDRWRILFQGGRFGDRGMVFPVTAGKDDTWINRLQPTAPRSYNLKNVPCSTTGSFYRAFTAEQAYELASRFELHYTPKKASWLKMAEVELSVISKQCLDRRIPDQRTLEKEVSALVEERNRTSATVHWNFTKNNARQKLERHYVTNLN